MALTRRSAGKKLHQLDLNCKDVQSGIFEKCVHIIIALAFTLLKLCQIILAIAFHGYRQLVLFAGKRLRPDLRKMVSKNFYLNPNGSPNVGYNLTVTFNLEGRVDHHQFTELFEQRLIGAKREENGELLFPEFQEEIIIWGGYPFWKKDPSFNLQNHILKGEEYFDCESMAAHLTPDEKYLRIENEILMKEFKVEGGSPWNCYLFQEPTKTILIFSIHHVMGDVVPSVLHC